ncbi:MAG: hypothetical protein IPM29_07420 [Planctomycetes bacterium]|nr:hypothetical protein [Planctomycetota bacterium]
MSGNTFEIPAIGGRRAAMLVAAFAALIACGPLAFALGWRAHTRSTPRTPQWDRDRFLDGSLSVDLAAWLSESSPVTVTARGLHNELHWLLGSYELAEVAPGRAGSLFLRGTLAPGMEATERAARSAVMRRVARWAERCGIELLAVPVPDKRRILPELLLPADRRAAAALDDRYDRLVGELRDAGIAVVPLAHAMARWHAERPLEELYGRRDTHWTAAATTRVAELVAAQLDAAGSLAAILPDPVVALPAVTTEVETDLGGMLGFDPDSAIARLYRESRELFGVQLAAEDGASTPIPVALDEAGIALCGDSFARQGFGDSLMAATGRLVDRRGVVGGGGPLTGLAALAGRIAAGAEPPRVVVWCFVERAMAEPHWTTAQAPFDRD